MRALLASHGFTFRKSLGQNFLINPTVCPRMAQAAGAAPGVGVLEIGAGVGVLTKELASRAERVTCVEIDERLRPVLEETLGGFGNIRLVFADAMQTDLRRLIEESFGGLRAAVAANLPYYLTSPLLMRLLESRLPVESVTVMVQREAARRLCARPGERACGAVSAAVWYFSEPEVLFSVSRGSFLPAPDVDSSVIRLRVRPSPPVSPPHEGFFFQTVRAAFSQRRKTVGNALSSTLHLPKEQVIAALRGAGSDPGARAETLTLEDFSRISGALLPLCGQHKEETP